MSRSLSLTFRQAIDAESDGSVVDVLLLTITHPTLTTPIYLSSDPTERVQEDPLLYGTVSRGNTYYFLPFEWVPPEDGDDTPPVLRLRVANFDQNIIALLRSVTSPPVITGEIVCSTTPNTVEITFPEFDLVSMNYDDKIIEMSLAIDSLVTIPVPAGNFTPKAFGGLF